MRQSLGDLGGALLLGFARKLRAWAQGEGEVPDSCQIADIRGVYRDAALPRCGTFVEIGGFDGETWSNTSFLADEGWRGLYVEPVPGHARKIAARHFLNRVRVEQRAVSRVPGPLAFSAMGPLSTAVADHRRAYESIDWARENALQASQIVVEGEPLDAILDRNMIPHDLDLLVVDVEGAEEPIVEALLESPWRPRALLVELADDHASFAGFPLIVASHRRTRAAIVAAGYCERYRDPINTLFIRDRDA